MSYICNTCIYGMLKWCVNPLKKKGVLIRKFHADNCWNIIFNFELKTDQILKGFFFSWPHNSIYFSFWTSYWFHFLLVFTCEIRSACSYKSRLVIQGASLAANAMDSLILQGIIVLCSLSPLIVVDSRSRIYNRIFSVINSTFKLI